VFLLLLLPCYDYTTDHLGSTRALTYDTATWSKRLPTVRLATVAGVPATQEARDLGVWYGVVAKSTYSSIAN
jgi:hypothetical protein